MTPESEKYAKIGKSSEALTEQGMRLIFESKLPDTSQGSYTSELSHSRMKTWPRQNDPTLLLTR